MKYSHSIDIDAPADVVFGVLAEIERWPEWTPTVTKVERLEGASQSLAIGSRARIVQPKIPPAVWTITVIEPGRGFRWDSRSPGATVVADHWVEPLDDGRRSRATLSVTFSGLLGRIVARLMRKLNERYLAQEAAGLKRRSEERAKSQPHSKSATTDPARA